MKKTKKRYPHHQYKYLVMIKWSEEDYAYVAEVPELPGCATHGDTLEETSQHINDAIASWIEGAREAQLEIPEPLALKQYSGRFVTRIDPAIHRNLSLKAKTQGKTLNGLVAEILSSACF